MDSYLKLLNCNDKRGLTDIEWIREFHDFLQGKLPKGMRMKKSHQPKLTADQSMAIIWYLQEHMPLLPDRIEMCCNCGYLYDTWGEGLHVEETGKNYCDGCEHLADLDKKKGGQNG